MEHAALALVRTRRWHQSSKAALFIGIPPVFECARGVVVAVFVGPGLQGSLSQSVSQRASAALKILDEVQRPEADQSRRLMGRGMILVRFIHLRRTLPGVPARANQTIVWDATAAGTSSGPTASTPGEVASAAAASPRPQAEVVVKQRSVERTSQTEQDIRQVAPPAESGPAWLGSASA